ncbi:MAG: hypothetical protein IKO84_05535 [Butyrivibrio sp.]|nr:hypothetical protein [Butyrivibrio sp.]
MRSEKVLFTKKKCLLAAIFSALALFVNLETTEPYESHIYSSIVNAVFELFEQAADMFAANGFKMFVAGIALYLGYFAVFGESNSKLRSIPVKGEKLLSAFFAIMYTGGKAFRFNDSLSSLWSPKFNLIKTAILIIGFYYIYLAATRLLYLLFEKRNEIILPESKLLKYLDKHSFIYTFLFIFIMWLPHLIFRFPGALSTDNWDQLNQFFGYTPLQTNQPIVHTMTVGVFVNFGLKVFGSANLGLFIYVLIQAAAMSFALAMTLDLFKEWKLPSWFRLIVMFLYTCTPYFAGNAAWAIKDYPHMIGYVLWGICFTRIVMDKKSFFSFKEDRKLIILWIVGAVLMSSYRKNGLHIYVIASLLYLGFVLIRSRSKKILSMLILFLIPIVLSVGIEKSIIKGFNVTEIAQKDAFSLPFQQTARYYHDYGDELTEEEREAIGDVLDFDLLYEHYQPECSDNVKMEYHAENTAQLIRYFKVWFLMFFKHPLCYIEATWNQNYYIFMPDFDNIVYNESCNVGNAIAAPGIMEYLDIHVPDAIQGFPIVICSMYRFLNRVPIFSTLNNLCIFVFILFAISLFMKRKNLSSYKPALAPLWLSLIFIILAPMIVDQPRYSWAIFYLMPMIMAMYMRLLDTKE